VVWWAPDRKLRGGKEKKTSACVHRAMNSNCVVMYFLH